MTLELAVYGLSASLLHRALPKNAACFYIALVVSMLAGASLGRGPGWRWRG